MYKPVVNVIVDLERGLDAARLHEVRSTLVDLNGVIRAQPSERLQRMMMVGYDPRVISAQEILASVRGRGLKAHLVGM
ncbi:MAG: hypothetical protein EHM83_00205 [Burkholderiales bacterium]|nr:MAG: hypothetical protein EHM83_09115 [Burkholderiales bacterium]RPH68054.1 MAG: hypothetical protein EHM83_00205 [Burkholderiales bacterium]